MPRRIIDLDRTAHDDNVVAERERRFGQRLAHPAARGVREIAHRVEILPRGPEVMRIRATTFMTGDIVRTQDESTVSISSDAQSSLDLILSCVLTSVSPVNEVRNLCLEQALNRGLNLGRLGHAAHAGAAAALPAFLRVDEVDAVAAERFDVALDGGLLPHRGVHRGGDNERAVEAEEQRAKKVVR